MSIRQRVFVTIIILCASVAIVGSVGIFSLSQYEKKAEALTQAVAQVNDIQTQRAELQSLHRFLDHYLTTRDKRSLNKIESKLLGLRKSLQKLSETTVCADCQEGFKKASTNVKKISLLTKDLEPAFQQDDRESVQAIENTIEALSHTTSTLLTNSAKMTADTAEELHSESHATYKGNKVFLYTVIFAAIALGLIVNYLVIRGITRSVNKLGQATQEFANGNRDTRINAMMPSEFSSLAQSFNQMAEIIQASERALKTINKSLVKEVDEHKDKLEMADKEGKQKMQEVEAYLAIAKVLNSTLSTDDALNQAASTLSSLFQADYTVFSLIDESTLSHCWEIEACIESSCPAYESANLECWTLNRTYCKNFMQGSFEGKIAKCIDCNVFKNVRVKVRAIASENKEASHALSGKTFSTSESICGKALLTLKPAVENLSEDSSIMGFKAIDPRCILQISFPLLTKNRVLGTASLVYASQRHFDDREIELMAHLCDQIAIGIENARLFKQTEKSAAEFSMLYDAGKVLSSLMKQDETLKHALHYAMKILNAESGIVYLFDEKAQRLKIVRSQNVDRDVIPLIGRRAGDGIIGHVMASNEPLLIDSRYKKHQFNLGAIHSAIFSPLWRNGQLFGAIGLLSFSDRFFTYNDLQLLSMTSSKAATNIHNNYLFEQLENMYFDTVKAFIKTIEAKDSYTKGHSENVAAYTIAIATALNLPVEKIRILKTAALLHDIGKIGVREEVLNKKDRLSQEEFEHIKQHPTIAYRILEHVPTLKEIAKIILCHHERYDGSGYPHGIKEEDIPFESRIITVADSFDAMTSKRPYRDSATLEAAKHELIKNAGTQFDPDIVRIFVTLLENGELPTIDDSRYVAEYYESNNMPSEKVS